LNATRASWRQNHGTTPPTGWTDEDRATYAEWLLSFQRRPWDWVLTCYPWGEPGSPLERRAPERWQREWLMTLQSELQRTDMTMGQVRNRVIRITTAAGNGVGKTGMVAWIVHWFMSVFPNGEAIVTAGTGDQLSGKTWRELNKWQNLAVNGWQFDWSAERYKHKDSPATWFAEARTWSENNPDAMAGTHENYVLIIFDEASAIAKIIWETVQGALTTGLCFFFAFGNPTELDDGFWETHHGKESHKWIRRNVDARSVSFANLEEINGWIDIWGADSDFVRIHVYGMFPKQSDLQFISSGLVREAADRNIPWREIPQGIPRLMGCDIARQGGDLNTVLRRQGRKVAAEVFEFPSRDTMATANFIAMQINTHRPDLCYIDGVGVGAGVVDYLRMRGYERIIVDVQSAMAPTDPSDKVRFLNMRALMWFRLREWLRGGDLPADCKTLLEELSLPHYKFMPGSDKLCLESKDDMRKRGIRSPNIADALAYTFWHAIPMANSSGASHGVVEPDV
jgi:hypothetical protein